MSNNLANEYRLTAHSNEPSLPLTMKAKKAAESVVYITQHLRMKDDYEEVRVVLRLFTTEPSLVSSNFLYLKIVLFW